MSTVCQHCGANLLPLSARCPACGTVNAPPVSWTAVTLAPEATPTGEHTPRSPPGGVSPTPGAGGVVVGPLAPGMSFGRRYHIKRLLGLGGMGAVYQAWDTELGIDVAIKLIRPDIISEPGAAAEIQRRFKRELLLARLVSHRNVVRIHDLGEIDGIKYITMSFVDGTDLATLLSREGQLPVRRALQITRRICDGLVAAHAAGVVHRDLKPANVMVGAGDDALITDFGVARLVGDRSDVEPGTSPISPPRPLDPHHAELTQAGSMVGTLEYMPPEQARGELVDQSADVYAVGLMLHDMLDAQARQTRWPTALDELKSRRERAPPPLRAANPDIPEAIDAVIARCTDPDPAKRYRSAAELAEALGRLDDDGRLLRVRRTVGLGRVSVVAVVLLLLIGGAAWWFRPRAPAAAHAPVSVVIADFANTTGDTGLDRTLEPVIKLSLESAPFITAYAHSDVRRALNVDPPEKFDERAASELAVKQGLGVVVSGAIEAADTGYRLRATARQAVSGQVLASAQRDAPRRDAVLGAVGGLADEIRQRLGDEASDAERRFAMDTLTATSIDVVHDYAAGMEALSSSHFEDARTSFQRAVQGDPNFGLAHAGLAIASANLGQQQEAQHDIAEAVRHVDRMTERERFRTRGLYYYLTADYPSCVKEYGALVARYRSDAAAHNNRALCLTRLREMPKALEEMREVVAILPNRALYRVNLALYAAYASDFPTARTEALRARQLSPLGDLPLAFAALGSGDLDEARRTYEGFAKASPVGASFASSGLGDLAVYAGRFGAAVRILQEGAAADRAAGSPDRAAAKLAAIAHAELARGRKTEAIAAARQALLTSQTIKIRFLAGRIYALTGDASDARGLVKLLADELPAEPRAYARILEGELALASGDPRKAIALLGEANGLLDTWIGRLELGRAYLEAGAFAQADSELDRCVTRRGEALSLFLDEEPTFGFYPPLEYYLGRVREGLHTAGFADAYRRYLALRGEAGEDPLLAEIRRRAGVAAAR
ncbi:MAG TPA: protein kinase [Myxococcaceae bacterium]|nr:protein kinase [Myxococcaceae bacterium]